MNEVVKTLNILNALLSLIDNTFIEINSDDTGNNSSIGIMLNLEGKLLLSTPKDGINIHTAICI